MAFLQSVAGCGIALFLGWRSVWPLGPSWAVLGPSGAILGPLGTICICFPYIALPGVGWALDAYPFSSDESKGCPGFCSPAVQGRAPRCLLHSSGALKVAPDASSKSIERFRVIPSCILWLSGAVLGPSWRHLAPSWGHLGPFWGHLGAVLGPSWAVLGQSGAILSCLGAISEPS